MTLLFLATENSLACFNDKICLINRHRMPSRDTTLRLFTGSDVRTLQTSELVCYLELGTSLSPSRKLCVNHRQWGWWPVPHAHEAVETDIGFFNLIFYLYG